MADKRSRPGDRAGDKRGIARRAAGQHLREALPEHGRLELQHGVQQPHSAEGELQRPARVERGHALVSSGRPPDRVADGEAVAHLLGLICWSPPAP
jgi:hypothetical protein